MRMTHLTTRGVHPKNRGGSARVSKGTPLGGRSMLGMKPGWSGGTYRA